MTTLYPHIDIFKLAGNVAPEARAGQAPMSARRPAIMSNLANDLYLALIDANEAGKQGFD